MAPPPFTRCMAPPVFTRCKVNNWKCLNWQVEWPYLISLRDKYALNWLIFKDLKKLQDGHRIQDGRKKHLYQDQSINPSLCFKFEENRTWIERGMAFSRKSIMNTLKSKMAPTKCKKDIRSLFGLSYRCPIPNLSQIGPKMTEIWHWQVNPRWPPSFK